MKTRMRIAIAGTRTWTDDGAQARVDDVIKAALERMEWTADMILSGHCSGVDCCGEHWAEVRDIHVAMLPALWNVFGSPHAAHMRNQSLALLCDAAIVIPHPDGRGTQDLMRRLRTEHKPHVICDAVTGKMTRWR